MIERDAHLQKIVFLVVARDEAPVIGKTVENIQGTMHNIDRLFVVSDRSSDCTAQIAEEHGAEVFIRNSGVNNKGAALAWFMKENQDRLANIDCIVILDADSSIKNDFREKLTEVWTEKSLAAQCNLQPVEYGENPIGNVIALSEIIEQDVFDSLRSKLGFSVRLRGTGMVFNPVFLINLCPFIGTEVEDIVLSLLVSKEGVRIRRLPSVIVYDPKPVDPNGASRQRSRWFSGQWDAFWKYRHAVGKLILQGPQGWTVIDSLFLKPRWLKIFILCALGTAFLWQPVVSILFFSLAAIDMILILIGAARLKDKSLFRQSLTHILGFVWMWIKAFMLSLKRQPWARARHAASLRDNSGDPKRIITPGDARFN